MKSKPKKRDDEKQSQRFIETAKKLGADESDKEFKLAIGIILPSKKPRKK